ncbi:MAG: fructose-6-phosphate aldolase [Clostridia bacterium]|nr:fructose-6-phosphate aldolase [Clostridia bacterium]
MEYILDTADIQAIKHCNEFYPLAGVTTNPSIIAKENRNFWEIVKEIRDIIGPDKTFFAQTVQKTADLIVEEAKLMNEKSGGDFCVKIPISEEGLKATIALKKLGIKVLMTAIFSPAQALIAAKAGADYVAPYVNRLDNIIGDGCEVVAEIVEQFAIHNMPCKVLAASFKNAQQVHQCAAAGCQCVTVSADVLQTVIMHPMTDAAIAGFERDWQNVYGDKKILDF